MASAEEGNNTIYGGTVDISQFATYEDYLDAHISERDLYYLEDEDLARQLVELGYRGQSEALKRDQFLLKKREILEMNKPNLNQGEQELASAGVDVSGFPLLQALAEREEDVRNGKLTTIIFIRDKNKKGQEVSGYIDFAHRLRIDDFASYFEQKKRLLPRPNDLSYFNWRTLTTKVTPTSNFAVITDRSTGIVFKNKRDRKLLSVDPNTSPGDNSFRVEIETDEYVQVVLYDHLTRRKS